MNVVVTGAAGFIGSHTCERLSARGHTVIGVDSFDDYLYPAVVKRRNARELAGVAQLRLVEGNICDPGFVESVLTNDVDVVCHLAALAGVRPSLAEPLRYVRTNVEGTNVLLERMRSIGLRRLVFASSSSVYGSRSDVEGGFREDDPCVTPASPYAATKRMGELLLSTYRDLYGIGSHALRFFTVFGPRQRPDMAIAKFTTALAANKPITLFGDGSTRRDYTFIDDIVTGTVAAIERVQPAELSVFNLGGTRTTSLSELVAMIEKTVGHRAIVEWRPEQPGDVPLTFANIDRARAALDYAPTTDVGEGIERYWGWFRRHLE